MRLIVADIGGTNARFAVSSQGEPSLCHITHLRCADFVGFEDAFERFLTGIPRDQQGGHHALSLAVAGPVNDQIVDVSNNHWRFDKTRLLERLALDKLLVINDSLLRRWRSIIQLMVTAARSLTALRMLVHRCL